MKAETQRSIIIVLLVAVIGVLLFPERIRKAVIEVVTEDTATGAAETNQTHAPEPQRITPFTPAKASGL